MKEISKKIVLLGNEAVGKTSLVKRYVHSIFNEEYLTTIGIKISKKVVQIEDTQVKLMIWDVAGDLLDKSLYDSYLRGAHGFFLVFDLTREQTHENIVREKENLITHFPDVSFLILGNKADLIDGDSPLDCDIQTSAKTGANVEEAFLELAKKIVLGEQK